MCSKNEKSQKIRREASDIAKCAGLTCSRIILLVCLLLLLYPMRPAAIYLIAVTALFPWVFGNILAGKESTSQRPVLAFCAQKYLYSPARYISERYTGWGLIILLAAWQLSVTRSPRFQGAWKMAPVCCLCLYCLCRLISTRIFRRKIHREYIHLELLE